MAYVSFLEKLNDVLTPSAMTEYFNTHQNKRSKNFLFHCIDELKPTLDLSLHTLLFKNINIQDKINICNNIYHQLYPNTNIQTVQKTTNVLLPAAFQNPMNTPLRIQQPKLPPYISLIAPDKQINHIVCLHLPLNFQQSYSVKPSDYHVTTLFHNNKYNYLSFEHKLIYNFYKSISNKSVHITPKGILVTPRLICIYVDIGKLPCTNQYPHITFALKNKYVRPVESNEALLNWFNKCNCDGYFFIKL
jgi:hypothetical protein